MQRDRRLALTAVFVAGLLSGCSTVRKPSYDNLIAHRGESFDAPENTMSAYRMAAERGFGFECDVYLSNDGRVFSFHDRNLKRTTGVDLPCDKASWSETVSKIDAGSWKGPKWKGERPALLEEILTLARDGRKIYVEIKSKSEIIPYIRAILSKQRQATPANIVFICFDKQVCLDCRRAMPDYPVYWLVCSRTVVDYFGNGTRIALSVDDLIQNLRDVDASGVDISWDEKIVTADYIRAVHDAGFSFHVWTVDDPETAVEVLRRGADTVTTNRAQYIRDAAGEF